MLFTNHKKILSIGLATLSLLVFLGVARAQVLQPDDIDLNTEELTDEFAPVDPEQLMANRRLADDDAKLEDIMALTQVRVPDAQINDCISQYTSPAKGVGGGSGGEITVEERGNLLKWGGQTAMATKNTDANTGQINELTTKICMHLKTIRRIQIAMEYKTFVGDPAARRLAATEIEQYKQELFKFEHTGYRSPESVQNGDLVVGEGDTAMHVGNLNDHLDSVTKETINVFQEDLRRVGNIFAQDVARKIEKDEYSGLGAKLKSTITKQQFDTFSTKGNTLPVKDWWNMLFAISEPQNNPAGSYLTAQSELDARKTRSEQNEREEILSGQGFLPYRECVEMTEDGKACRKWLTISPGSVMNRSINDAIKARLDQYVLADGAGEVLPGNNPTAFETQEMLPSLSGGGGPGPLDPTGQNCESMGTCKPQVTVTYTVPTLTQINAGEPNTATVAWSTKYALDCKADNTWVTQSPTATGTISSIYDKGASIGTSGTTTIKLPLNFTIRMTRGSSEIPGITTYDANKLTQTTVFTVPSEGWGNNVRASLILGSSASSTTITTTDDELNGAGAVQDFNILVDSLITDGEAEGRELSKYNFAFNYTGSQSTITVSTRPTYTLKCFNGPTYTRRDCAFSRDGANRSGCAYVRP